MRPTHCDHDTLQAYGMMGWRVGYIAYPTADGGRLGAELLKVQDTVRWRGGLN